VRIKLHFTPLDSVQYARQLEADDPTVDGSRRVLVKSFRSNTITVTVENDHPTRLWTTVLDEDSEPFGDATAFTYHPRSQEVASSAPSLDIEEVVVLDDGRPDVLSVTVQPKDEGVSVPTADASTPANDDTTTKESEQIEVRTIEGVSTTPEDALEVGVFKRPASQSNMPLTLVVPRFPDEDQQTIFSRKIDVSSGRRGAWNTKTVSIFDPVDYLSNDDFSTNFAGGTIGQSHAVDTMKIDGSSRLVHNEVPSMFSSTVWSRSVFYDSLLPEDVPVFSMDAIFPIGIFTAPEVDQGVVADFHPNVIPATDNFNRSGHERSVFSTESDYAVFRQPDAVISARPRATRYLREGTEDISMFGAASFGAPMRIKTWVKREAGAFEEWHWGERILAQKFTFKLWSYAGWGLHAPFYTKWWWRRWRRNRKWEFLADWEPGANEYMDYVLPDEVVTVLADPTIQVAAKVGSDQAEVGHDVVYMYTPGTKTIRIRVVETQTTRESVTTGEWGWTYARAFKAAPRVFVTPDDPAGTEEVFSGYDTRSASSVSGYMVSYVGDKPNGDVDLMAVGIPVAVSGGGDVKLRIQVMGA